ncbi:MAG: hypothetical protein JJT75_01915, partial [Opitutales bacterium]|nr:hypothetical protein [Opitutales bacterium]
LEICRSPAGESRKSLPQSKVPTALRVSRFVFCRTRISDGEAVFGLLQPAGAFREPTLLANR